jgi:hypothetical protein
MQVFDVFTMTGSPADEIALLEEIGLRLVSGANELLVERAQLRAALEEIQTIAHQQMELAMAGASNQVVTWSYTETLARQALKGKSAC